MAMKRITMKMVVATIIGALLVCGGVLGGFLFALEICQSNTSSSLPEYLAITSVEYGVDPDGWIALTVNNTGISTVTIAKILVNDTRQSSVSPSLPITIAPDNGFVLNSTMNITQSEIYKIDLLTSKGNMFSESSQAPMVPGHLTGQAGVALYPANVRFYRATNNQIEIDVQNKGTSDAHLIQVYVGISSSNLQSQISPSLPLTCVAGGVVAITVDYNWTAGGTYYFKVMAQEQVLGPWAEQSQVS
jgi:hypothetical protein